MNTKEKIDRGIDTSLLCLHKEGIFYKLYNQHAMLFTANIKELKIKTKFIKAVNQQVYSCGFPTSIIEEIKFVFLIVEWKMFLSNLLDGSRDFLLDQRMEKI